MDALTLQSSAAHSAPGNPGADSPARVAAIDVGSNAIRFIAAEFTEAAGLKVLNSERAPVRLGTGVFRSGRLASGAIEEAIAAFSTFRDRLAEFEVARYRAVATSAVRESENSGEFTGRVRQETGIELECITPAEEARLVQVAVGRVVALSGTYLLADLGGGSLEVSVIAGSGIRWSESFPLGAVRLLDRLREDDGDPAALRRLLATSVAARRIEDAAAGEELAGMVAVGGNIEVLAKLAEVVPDATGTRILPLAKLSALVPELSRLSARERMEHYQLRQDRADVILPAAVVYEFIAERARADRIVVAEAGVKEGILWELAIDPARGRAAG